jgi:hypothetical protein
MFRATGSAVMKQEKAGSCTGFCMVIIIRNASLYFGTVQEEFQRATFFSLFFIASANQDFCDLALGRHSRVPYYFAHKPQWLSDCAMWRRHSALWQRPSATAACVQNNAVLPAVLRTSFWLWLKIT